MSISLLVEECQVVPNIYLFIVSINSKCLKCQLSPFSPAQVQRTNGFHFLCLLAIGGHLVFAYFVVDANGKTNIRLGKRVT